MATEVAGCSERTSYLRDNGKMTRVDASNINESVELLAYFSGQTAMHHSNAYKRKILIKKR